MKKAYKCLIFILAILNSLHSSDLIINFRDGTTESIGFNEIKQFYFVDSSDVVVRLTSPFNGAVNLSLQPEFQWRIIPGQQFELMIADNAEFIDPVAHITDISGNVFQLDQPLAIHTVYYWRVRASVSMEWSTVWQFTTYSPNPPGQIKSFAIKNSTSPNTLEIVFFSEDDIDSLIVDISEDGINFPITTRISATSPIIQNLEIDKLYFFRICGMNSAGAGSGSELLAGIPTAESPHVMIINGFDRSSTGNTYNFIRQHATAINFSHYTLETATNDAISDGLIKLSDYEIVDFILGEESTADETFSNAEQDYVEDFLNNGGKLFVSGSEIAWDLDYKGSTADKAFCHNYLKIMYAADAPNNQSSTWYSIEPVSGTFFNNLSGFSFDNGYHGTYNVDYPDVIKPSDGGKGILKYINYDISKGYSGVAFDGIFPNGSNPGKLVITGFPFEAIYPDSSRNNFMQTILDYFQYVSENEPAYLTNIPDQFTLSQNYPNPFNSTTIIPFQIPQSGNVRVSIFDLLGRELMQVTNQHYNAGYYRLYLDSGALSSGEYLYIMETREFRKSRKLCIIK